MNENDFKLPMFFICGARPVKFIKTENNGMDVLVFDWEKKIFIRQMDYLTKALYSDESEEITEEEFNNYVNKLLKKQY